MKKIFKYQIGTFRQTTIKMPHPCEILCIQMQDGGPCIWAIVEPDSEITKERTFRIYGNGEIISENLENKYIGTYQHEIYVWHVFEEIIPSK